MIILALQLATVALWIEKTDVINENYFKVQKHACKDNQEMPIKCRSGKARSR